MSNLSLEIRAAEAVGISFAGACAGPSHPLYLAIFLPPTPRLPSLIRLTTIAPADAPPGVLLTFSAAAIPSLLAHDVPPPLLVRQWQTAFDAGKIISPGSSIVAAAGWIYAARAHPAPGAARLYGAAAATVMGIHPWTFLAIMPTNRGLWAAVDKGDKVQKAEARELVARWGMLNWVRFCFPVAAVAMGACAMAAF